MEGVKSDKRETPPAAAAAATCCCLLLVLVLLLLLLLLLLLAAAAAAPCCGCCLLLAACCLLLTAARFVLHVSSRMNYGATPSPRPHPKLPLPSHNRCTLDHIPHIPPQIQRHCLAQVSHWTGQCSLYMYTRSLGDTTRSLGDTFAESLQATSTRVVIPTITLSPTVVI